jgi:hypothetical protein
MTGCIPGCQFGVVINALLIAFLPPAKISQDMPVERLAWDPGLRLRPAWQSRLHHSKVKSPAEIKEEKSAGDKIAN